MRLGGNFLAMFYILLIKGTVFELVCLTQFSRFKDLSLTQRYVRAGMEMARCFSIIVMEMKTWYAVQFRIKFSIKQLLFAARYLS